MKTIAVFGATGSVGSAVTKLLTNRGNRVIKIGHHEKNRKKLMENSPGADCYFADVGKYEEVKCVANRLQHENIAIDSVIYTVGKYEKEGYLNRKASSVSCFSPELIREGINAQFTGLLFVFNTMLPSLVNNASMIFVSTVAHEDFAHEVVTYGEQERIIGLMRNNYDTVSHNILIHHLGFGPIDTHYYDRVWVVKGTLPLESVTKEIVAALDFSGHTSFTKMPSKIS